jgi:glycerol-3-phosphate O-acyltransferase
MLRSFDPAGERDIAFIPVGVNYDRTFEDRSFLLELDSDSRRPGALRTVATTLRFVSRNFWLMARNRWHRFGYACVNFGSPVSLRQYVHRRGIDFRQLPKDRRFAEVEALARELMSEIARVIPVVPVSLAATVFARDPGRAWSELELKAEILRLIRELEARGARVYLPRSDQDYAITVGLRMLTLRRLVDGAAGLYKARPEELPLLNYYAHSIAHHFGVSAAEAGRKEEVSAWGGR